MDRFNNNLTMLAPMLYVPADRTDLCEVLSGKQDYGVCSIALCLEDAVRPDNRKSAAIALGQTLNKIGSIPRPIFIRPADAKALEWILEHLPMNRIAGFILPKATVNSIHLWVEMSLGMHTIIPIMETREALDPVGRRELAQACLSHSSQIPGARIGANDIFSLLGGLRRPSGRTVYETPVGRVIDGLLEAFYSQGVKLSAPVCDRISEFATLEREIKEDIHRGLFAKTAIHPSQVKVIWKSYEPYPDELEDARRILEPDAPAVFSSNGDMLEPSCHAEWARRLIGRNALYRVASEEAIISSRENRNVASRHKPLAVDSSE